MALGLSSGLAHHGWYRNLHDHLFQKKEVVVKMPALCPSRRKQDSGPAPPSVGTACLPVGRGPANRGGVLCPVRKPVAAGMKLISLWERTRGFNAPVRAFPLECQDLLTGFTFCFIEGRILFVICGGLDGTGGEEGPWSL